MNPATSSTCILYELGEGCRFHSRIKLKMDSVQASFGRSLIEAVKENDVQFLKALLVQGAYVNTVDEVRCDYICIV